LAGIGPPARRCRDEQSAEHYPAVERLPPTSAVADFKSESVADFIPESVADFARNTHITPGITIRDRLQVLYSEHPESYYRSRELLPNDLLGDIAKAAIVITNYHAFQHPRCRSSSTSIMFADPIELQIYFVLG